VKRTSEWPRVLEVDYSAARAQAIRWLGDRYLLARPINLTYRTGPEVPAVGKRNDAQVSCLEGRGYAVR
jgi:hypothetical protein